MSKMLIGSIDLNKIDKTKIVTTDAQGNPFKNGAKYYNVVVWINDTPDQYGNIAGVQESMTKIEKDNGAKPNYIGNLKEFQSNKPQQSATLHEKEQAEKYPTIMSGEGDLPF